MKKLNKTHYILLIGLINLIYWTITFILRKYNINQNTVNIIEGIELVSLAILMFLTLILNDNLFYSIPILTYVPFIFSRPFDILTIPLFLYISILLSIIGIVIHLIKYKLKIKIGKLFIGLSLFSLSLILGGLFVKENPMRLNQFFMMLAINTILLFVYTLFISKVKDVDFNLTSSIINTLSLIIISQVFIYYIFNPLNISTKTLNLGYGISNNIALLLLLTMPYSFYKATTYSNYKRYLYLIYTGIQYLVILISYSKGCIAIGFIGLLIMIILGFKYFKSNIKYYILTIISFLLFLSLLILIVQINNKSFIPNLITNIFKALDFTSLNGRSIIYKNMIIKSLDHPLFGHGIYYPFIYNIDSVINGYLWGHSTLIHSLFTTGIIGTIFLIYHLIEKYLSLIKNINPIKLTILLSFALSGLYGLFDLSYYYINYMIVLIIIFVLIDNEIERIIRFKHD